MEHVNGKDKGHVLLFALSTCGWCAKTKKLLNDLGVAYDYEYVDLLEGKSQSEAIDKIRKWNPSSSFPTLIVNNQKCIVGFKEDDIREALR